jgi:hypothetical protein
MKKILLLLFLFSRIIDSSFSQDLYLKTGVNSTKYKFVDDQGQPIYKFLPAIAPSFEIGYGYPISGSLVNEFGLSLDGYNSKGDTNFSDYDYSTFYGGIRNSTSFNATFGDLEVGMVGLLGASKILSGDQLINNSRFDLTEQADFKGVFFHRGIGINFNYFFRDEVLISSGIDYSIASKLDRIPSENLSFVTTRVLFGIHFILD